MDDDLNVGNLLETNGERAPSSKGTGPMSRTRAVKPRAPFSIRGWAVAAAVAVLAMVMISGTSARRVHVIERY
jgi:hypothetical protein